MKTILKILIFLLASYRILYAQEPKTYAIPLIGDKAPSFMAESTNGPINFPSDYGRHWKILFSHPADFTPVCSSEILELASMQADFDKLGVKVAVISTDAIDTHYSWKKSLESISYSGHDPVKIKFPLIEDKDKQISSEYGMLHQSTFSSKDVRGVFIVDPDDRIAAIFFYPSRVGRDFDEIKRTVIALQTADEEAVLTPANWKPGSDVMLPYLSSNQEADGTSSSDDPTIYNLSWYMWFKKAK
ncbi:MAG: redoxin domain-containing protein [Bacteroidetes bacterium]|nr:redoxin domain-containing protein [Bacteroidota bacterium]